MDQKKRKKKVKNSCLGSQKDGERENKFVFLEVYQKGSTESRVGWELLPFRKMGKVLKQ